MDHKRFLIDELEDLTQHILEVVEQLNKILHQINMNSIKKGLATPTSTRLKLKSQKLTCHRCQYRVPNQLAFAGWRKFGLSARATAATQALLLLLFPLRSGMEIPMHALNRVRLGSVQRPVNMLKVTGLGHSSLSQIKMLLRHQSSHRCTDGLQKKTPDSKSIDSIQQHSCRCDQIRMVQFFNFHCQ